MAAKCPKCGSSTVSHGIGDHMQCLECASLFDSKGNLLERGPDATTRAVMEARLAPRTTSLAGNLADIQRFGASKAPDPDAPDFPLPPGVDPADLPPEDSPQNRPSEVRAAMSSTGDEAKPDVPSWAPPEAG